MEVKYLLANFSGLCWIAKQQDMQLNVCLWPLTVCYSQQTSVNDKQDNPVA
jgi:hypothetical protein